MKRIGTRSYRNPARYRLEFIKENTFNRLWSIPMTRPRAILAAAVAVVAIGTLIASVILFTPVRRLLPGHLGGNLRAEYIDVTLRLDSLEQVTAQRNAYARNLARVLSGEATSTVPDSGATTAYPDSLLQASEAEKDFVRQYNNAERYNRTVLAPLAADGMVFGLPAEGVSATPAGMAVLLCGSRDFALSAIYRGTVVSATPDNNGTFTVIVQHPNDFLTVYTGLGDIYTERGARLLPGQRIGRAANTTATFELWHQGVPLPPLDYIPM